MRKWKKISCLLLILVIVAATLVYTPTVSLEKDYTTLDLTLTDNEFYLDEDNYEEEMTEVVEPYLAQYLVEGYSYPEEDVANYYRSYILEDSIGTVVISHGFSENVEKFTEVIYYFLKAGYSVYAIDHRDHGYSTRETEDKSKVTADSFQDYVTDFISFMDNIVLEEVDEDEPLYLYAHSMGGAIGASVLEQYPELFDKAVLSSPMMEIDLGLPVRIGKIAANFMVAIGLGNNYLPGHAAYVNGVWEEVNPEYASVVRNDYWYSVKDSNEYYQSNGGTFSWLKACFKGIDELLSTENMEQVTTPVLLFQAEEDSMVLPSGQNTFVNGVDSAELVLVENTEHSIFQSSNDVLIPYFNTIFAYFAE